MLYGIVTFSGDFGTLETGNLGKTLDPKGGLLARRFVTVKDPMGNESIIPVESIKRIYPLPSPPGGTPAKVEAK